MSGNGAKILVRRGSIEGHVRPPGGDFITSALIWPPLTPLVAPFFGVHCVDTTDRVVSLTYDDGPHPQHTPAILDALAAHQVSATFFVLLSAARKNPEILTRMLVEGHRIGLHGSDHRSLLSMSTREAVQTIGSARDELEQLTGTAVRLYRPPYGHHTPGQARGVRRLGLQLLLWSDDGLDWIDRPMDQIVARATDGIFPGAVLLLHDDRADPEMLGAGESLPRFDKALLTERILQRLDEKHLAVTDAEAMLDRYPQVLSGSRERMRRRR